MLVVYRRCRALASLCDGNGAAALVLSRGFKLRRSKTKKPISPIPLTPVIKSVLQGREDPNPPPLHEEPSRNWLKRRSKKGLALVRLMATLATGQIKNVIQWASLPPEVLEATLTVQKMEVTGVKEAKRRQYRLIEGHIRHCRLDVLEYVIYCVRLGKTVSLQHFFAEQLSLREKYVKATSDTWVNGLMDNELALSRQIYTLPYEYDRQELRRLLRDFKTTVNIARQSKKQDNEEMQKSKRRRCVKAKKMLMKFMASVAHKDFSTKCLSGEFTRPMEIESGAAALSITDGRDELSDGDESEDEAGENCEDQGLSSGSEFEDSDGASEDGDADSNEDEDPSQTTQHLVS